MGKRPLELLRRLMVMCKNKTTRYVPSLGLAFAEKKEMEKLSKLAEEGWILDSFAFLGYKLCKRNVEKLIYSVDYNDPPHAEQEEYLQIFREGGMDSCMLSRLYPCFLL